MRVNGSWCSKRGIDPVMLYLRDACPSRERCSNKIDGSYTKVHATMRSAQRALVHYSLQRLPGASF